MQNQAVGIESSTPSAALSAAPNATSTAAGDGLGRKGRRLGDPDPGLMGEKAAGGDGGSNVQLGNWAQGTSVNSNQAIDRDTKKRSDGKAMSKKEERALKKNSKRAGGTGTGAAAEGSDGAGADKTADKTAEKAKKRAAKKLLKEGVAADVVISATGVQLKEGALAAAASNAEGASGRVQRSTAELEEEMRMAMEQAARLRALEGSYRGAIEAQAFTLPNPGGGANLLEDASFVLVPGRRYGLIGRNGKGIEVSITCPRAVHRSVSDH